MTTTTDPLRAETLRLLRLSVEVTTDPGGKGYTLGMISRFERGEAATPQYIEQVRAGLARHMTREQALGILAQREGMPAEQVESQPDAVVIAAAIAPAGQPCSDCGQLVEWVEDADGRGGDWRHVNLPTGCFLARADERAEVLVTTEDGDEYVAEVVERDSVGRRLLVRPTLANFGGAQGDPEPAQLEPRWITEAEVTR